MGIQDTLQKYKPNFWVELGDMNVVNTIKSKTIIGKLIKLNYVPFEWHSGKFIIHNVKKTYNYCNLLFTERNKIELYNVK